VRGGETVHLKPLKKNFTIHKTNRRHVFLSRKFFSLTYRYLIISCGVNKSAFDTYTRSWGMQCSWQCRGLKIGINKKHIPPAPPRRRYFFLFRPYAKIYSSWALFRLYFCPFCIYFILFTPFKLQFPFFITFSSFFFSISYFSPKWYQLKIASPWRGGGYFTIHTRYTPVRSRREPKLRPQLE
jgi:hypothetical protein